MFFWSVFRRFLTCFWLLFLIDFTCFSRPCSNCVFAYFFLGCFSNVCTLSKHGIFKRHCFSQVKTLFWRIRLCRRNFRIFFFGDRIVPVFLLNFQVFWHVFLRSFSHRFFNAFFTKNMSKLTPKLSGAHPLFRPFSRLRFFVVFLLIVVRGDRRHLEILAVEAIIFVHETGGHWQKQASLH